MQSIRMLLVLSFLLPLAGGCKGDSDDDDDENQITIHTIIRGHGTLYIDSLEVICGADECTMDVQVPRLQSGSPGPVISAEPTNDYEFVSLSDGLGPLDSGARYLVGEGTTFYATFEPKTAKPCQGTNAEAGPPVITGSNPPGGACQNESLFILGENLGGDSSEACFALGDEVLTPEAGADDEVVRFVIGDDFPLGLTEFYVSSAEGEDVLELNVVNVTDPVVTSIDPDSGPEGTLVTITGENLGATTEVRFAGAGQPNTPTFTVVSDTTITFTVGLTDTGNFQILVSNPCGNDLSTESFSITP